VDWKGSLSSNYAMLHVSGCMDKQSSNQDQKPDLGFLVDPKKGDEWIKAFKARSHASLFQPTPTKAKVEEEAAAYMADIYETNKEIFRKCRPPHPKASPWWNAAYAIAAQNLCDAQTTEMQGLAQAKLKGTVQAAKRNWADEYIEKAKLWDVAAWRHE
jgi:hypothetical protein